MSDQKNATVVLIVAGTNEPSNSETLAHAFTDGLLSEKGITVTKFRLRDLHIKHFTLERYAPQCEGKDDDFCKMQDALQVADAVIIASPVWNFSVPAHLKNLIDRMGAFALDQETHSKGQLNAKPFYLIYTGGAPMIAWKALLYITTLHVSEAIKYYGGVVVGRHFEPKSMLGRGKFGLTVDKRPESLTLMHKEGKKFASIAKHYAENGSLPLSNRLWYKICSFLYRIGNRIMYPVSTMQ